MIYTCDTTWDIGTHIYIYNIIHLYILICLTVIMYIITFFNIFITYYIYN